jgi:hypothetical protein
VARRCPSVRHKIGAQLFGGAAYSQNRGHRVALGHEQQGVRPPAQARVGVGSGKAPQIVGALGKGGAHGSTSAPPPHTPVQDFCRSV